MVQMRGRSRVLPSVLCFVLILCFGVAAFAQTEDVRVSANVQINDPQQAFPDDFPGRNTTSLASTADGRQILATWDDLEGFCGPPANRPCPIPDPSGLTGYGYSNDGGRTWTDAGMPPTVDGTQLAGHGWIDRGGKGGEEVFYLVARQRDPNTGATVGVAAYRGAFAANGTFVWDNTQILPQNEGGFISRPAVAARKNASGAAYVVVIDVIEICGVAGAGFGQVEVFRTHNSGTTWEGPAIVSPDPAENNDPDDPNCGATGPFQIAPAIEVGPKGEVYVAWVYGPRINEEGGTDPTSTIAFSRSLDGGRTFSERQTVVTINSMFNNSPVGYAKSRMNDQPRIAVATSGPHKGRVYITYQQPVRPVTAATDQQSPISSQIYITWSDDQGATWSTPTQLAPPVPPNRIKRFWPTVSVRNNGDVDVVYLESRERQATADPTDIECNIPIGGGLFRAGRRSSLVDTYMVQSHDGGSSFSAPLRISTETSNWCTANFTFGNASYSNFGDYLGTVSLPNRTLAAWPDSRNGFPDVFFASVKGRLDD